MYRLRNSVQAYAWGSRTAIAELLGAAAPSSEPQAELWLGAHPVAPSSVLRATVWESLEVWISAESEFVLGARSLARFGPKLPFLLKVLAAETPLSLQAHPNAEQALRGYQAEELLGIPLSAPHRNYKDPHAKPELICALTPFAALSGFRPFAETTRLLRSLDLAELAVLLRECGAKGEGAAQKHALETLLRAPRAEQAELAARVAEACEAALPEHEFQSALAWAKRIAALYPGDIGVLIALMLNLVELRPGEALFMPAGTLHSYLQGVGVEILAASDNVLRAGLTSKHIATEELLGILEFAPYVAGPVQPVRAAEGEYVYRTQAAEFELSRLELEPGIEPSVAASGPEILLVLTGIMSLRCGAVTLELQRGESVFLAAGDGPARLSGTATVFRARVPD